MQKKNDNLRELIKKNVPTVNLQESLLSVREKIKGDLHKLRIDGTIYVLDSGKFVGITSLEQVFLENKGGKVEDVCQKNDLVSASISTTPEKVAYVSLRHDLKSVPILDKDGLFLGVIDAHTISKILYTEIREDLLHLAGVNQHKPKFDNINDIPLWKSLEHRIPWLVLGLAGGLVTARVVESFESVLSINLTLAAFIPLIVYMSDAVGTQMEAFIIRDLAADHKFNFLTYFLRQLLVVVVIALFCSGALLAIERMLGTDFRLALVISLSLGAAVISSVFTGLLIPFMFGKIKMDPANASGPIATVIQDFASVLIYFAIASALL